MSSLKAFSHLNAEKAPLYRAVMGEFVHAKERFSLHLRPQDILFAISSKNSTIAGTQPDELEHTLRQLVEWGNLEAHRDISAVATVEEFYRPRFLYQLTTEGEAVERALLVFYETLEKPGELQTAALEDICDLLEELVRLAANDTLDAAKVHRTFHSLRARFEELTSRAQTFMRGLQQTIDLHGISVEAFIAYKETLIDYLERFIGELVLAMNVIARKILRLEELGEDRLLGAAAARDLIDALEESEEASARALKGWRERWAGFRAWFFETDGAPSQGEVLRARARSAIPALLVAVSNIHDRRVTRTDRTADFLALARWFADVKSDDEAHALWRTAFCLSPARHLRVDAETVDAREQTPVSAQTSWSEAPPVSVSPRLRKTGRAMTPGAMTKAIDRGREKRTSRRID